MNSELFDDLSEFEERPANKKRGKRAFWCCSSLVLIPILLIALVAGGYVWNLRNAYTKNTGFVTIHTGTSDARLKGKGTNILLLGSDKRDPEEAKLSGVVGQRSDVMMLVHINADNSEVFVASFPRDLYVDIPGHGKDRINAALAFGGVALSVDTVENYVGVPIDHALLVDFDGITGIVNTLGGVDVNIPETFQGDGVQFTKGVQHLDGREALVFVRQRYQFKNGDFQRNANQREVLRAIVEKILAKQTLTDPGKILQLTQQITPYLTVDTGLTPEKIVELGFANRSIRGHDIHYLEVPHGEPFMTSGGASVVATNEPGMDKFRDAVKNDTMKAYVSNPQ